MSNVAAEKAWHSASTAHIDDRFRQQQINDNVGQCLLCIYQQTLYTFALSRNVPIPLSQLVIMVKMG